MKNLVDKAVIDFGNKHDIKSKIGNYEKWMKSHLTIQERK